ncbi:UNVERIFIED_ORG: HxlR family transcriptional regulator [Gordonia westfalica J30]
MSEISAPDHAPRTCDEALRRAFGFLGKRWNGILIATLMNGPAGFAELRCAVGGISDSVLSGRLSELTEANLVERLVDPGPPVSVSYELTESGRALMPALTALTAWAWENLPPSASAD